MKIPDIFQKLIETIFNKNHLLMIKNKSVDYIRKSLSTKLNMFRLFATVFAVDVVAVMALGSISPLNFINPLRFLQTPAVDMRVEKKFYFPSAFEDENDKIQVLGVAQKISLSDWDQLNSEQKAYRVIDVFSDGPDALIVRGVMKDRMLIRRIWLKQQDTLIIDVDKKMQLKYSPEEWSLLKESVEKTLQENIAGITAFIWVEGEYSRSGV